LMKPAIPGFLLLLILTLSLEAQASSGKIKHPDWNAFSYTNIVYQRTATEMYFVTVIQWDPDSGSDVEHTGLGGSSYSDTQARRKWIKRYGEIPEEVEAPPIDLTTIGVSRSPEYFQSQEWLQSQE